MSVECFGFTSMCGLNLSKASLAARIPKEVEMLVYNIMFKVTSYLSGGTKPDSLMNLKNMCCLSHMINYVLMECCSSLIQ